MFKQEGRSQKFCFGGDKTGATGDRSPPVGSRGREAKDIYANNHSDNVLTKTTKKFISMGISGGGGMSPLSPPSLCPCGKPLKFVYTAPVFP